MTAVGSHAVATATYHDTLTDIASNTDRRDISEMLDLWCHKETPLLNRLSWGAETGATTIEWISEHLGFGYLVTDSEVTTASGELIIASSGMGTVALALEQVTTGTLLYGYDSTTSSYAIIAVSDIASPTVDFNVIAASDSASTELTLLGGEKLYIIGDAVGEGSGPRADTSRTRSILTNNMTILRKDVQLTGSMAATDFHAGNSELKHQLEMRLKEMQRDREMHILLSMTATATSTAAGHMNGCLGFLEGQAGDHIQDTSQALTENGVNDMVAACYENNGSPSALVLSVSQGRKFTAWDRDKIRTAPDARLAGHFVTKYLTDVGTEIEIIMVRQFPANMAFILDTSKIQPRAKKGRKLFMDKLGIDGDRIRYQILSEFSLEMKGYDKGQHGMWNKLTP